MNPLLSAAELGAVQEVARSSMQTSVAIYAGAKVQTVDGQETVWTYASTVLGSLFSTPQPLLNVVSGEVAMVNVVALRVPVDTAIASGDHVVIGGATYTVEDVARENTWPAMWTCSIRGVE